MTIYYLYIKTHTTTGFKYLGQTSKQDPYIYCGSGKDWVPHLKQHGFTVQTEILRICNTKEELNFFGRYYSSLYKVTSAVDDYGNRIWANRIPETGGGGSPSDKTREKLRNASLGKPKPPRNPKHTEKIASQARGKSNPKTAAGLRKYFDSGPDRSRIIEKQSNSIKEWYQKNPKMAHQKAFKTWDGIYKKDYEKYKKAVSLIAAGRTNREITKSMKIDSATINKLRSGNHRVYELFSDLDVILGA